MHYPRGNLWLALLILLGTGSILVGCDKPDDGTQQLAGVISTGNAGRIQGRTVSDNQGLQVTVRLVKIKVGGDSLVDSVRTDTGGTFAFNKVTYGSYRVEAWREGKLQGRSGIFLVDKDLIKDILIILVQPVRYLLDASSIGNVDSMFLDYPGNPASKEGDFWSVRGLKGDSGTIYTRVASSSGATTWLSWEVKPVGDSLKIVSIGSTPNAPFIKRIDTSAFFLTPHTMALWTFDEVSSSGVVHDLSGHGCDLTLPSGAGLETSPHGKALLARSLHPNVPASTNGSRIPSALVWAHTGMQTMEMRIKVDSLELGGYYFMGTYVGPHVGISVNGAIAVYQQVDTSTSSSPIWYGTISDADVVPVGKWIDISIAIDQTHNDIYLWINGQPIPMYPTTNAQVARMVVDSTYPFQVGGSSEDSRVGPFQIDEVRISDTLVFGQGIRTQPSFSIITPLSIVGISSEGACSNCELTPIGSQTATSEAFIFVKPSTPASVVDRRIISCILTLRSSSVPSQSKRFYAHRLLKQNIDLTRASTPPVAGIDYEVAPLAAGILQATSRGGIQMEIGAAVQEWLDHPDQAKGILIRAVDPASTSIQVYSNTTTSDAPSMKIQYH